MLKKITFEIDRFCQCQSNTIQWMLIDNQLNFRCNLCLKVLSCSNPLAYIWVDTSAPIPNGENCVIHDSEQIVSEERPWPPTIAYYRKELDKFLKETLPEEESVVVEPKKEMIH